MNKLFSKYAGKDLPIDERLFYAASFMSALASLVYFSVFVLLRVSFTSGFLFLSISVVSAFLFFLEKFFKQTKTFTLILLFYCNFFAFPFMLFDSNKLSLEIPIYFVIGICFALIMLKGSLRSIYIFSQILYDLIFTYYCFVIRVNNPEFAMATGEIVDYIRIELAVLCTGSLSGLLLKYRNKMLSDEIKLRKDDTSYAEHVSFAKDMFLVNVSHEIRTPLNAIIGTTEMLLDSDASNHIKESAFNISNSSHALLSITSDLLDFSRMNIDSIRPVEERYDLSLLFNDIINLMSVRLLDSNVDFFVRINPEIPRILIGDQGKIRQIIINLLSNAIKFTKEGYMSLFVDFEYRGRDKIKLTINVEDTGIGIEADNLEHIFEEKQNFEELEKYISEGNGMGLALCRKLANAMSGKLYVTSEVNKGSNFIFEVEQSLEIPNIGGVVGALREENITVSFLKGGRAETGPLKEIFKSMSVPYEIIEYDDAFVNECKNGFKSYYMLDSISYERIKDSLIDAEIDWSKIVVLTDCNYTYSGEPFEYVLTKPISCLNVTDLFNHNSSYSVRTQRFEGRFTIPDITILVVDDNLVNLEVAAGLLQKYGCKVITAASGKECLITLKSEPVDIVFLDYMMPEMDGIDTLKEIRKMPDEKFKKLPVISLTANVVSGAREMFLDAGFDDYLSKPIETDKMEKTIMDHLPSEAIKFSFD